MSPGDLIRRELETDDGAPHVYPVPPSLATSYDVKQSVRALHDGLYLVVAVLDDEQAYVVGPQVGFIVASGWWETA